MTALAMDVRELNFDEIDLVTGGDCGNGDTHPFEETETGTHTGDPQGTHTTGDPHLKRGHTLFCRSAPLRKPLRQDTNIGDS